MNQYPALCTESECKPNHWGKNEKVFYLKSQPHLVRAIGLCFSWLCLQIFQGGAGSKCILMNLVQFTKRKIAAIANPKTMRNVHDGSQEKKTPKLLSNDLANTN